MPNFLLDTNHASRLMSRDPQLLETISQHLLTGSTFSLSITIVGELYYAAYASQRQAKNLSRLESLLSTLLIYPFDTEAAELFGQIQAEQKAKGRPIPPSDAQIAAVARLHHLTVLTADKHFAYINDIVTENWLR